MPNDKFYDTYPVHGRGRSLIQVAWQRGSSPGGVRLSGAKFEDGIAEDEAEARLLSHLTLRKPEEVDRLIKTLKKARRQVWPD